MKDYLQKLENYYRACQRDGATKEDLKKIEYDINHIRVCYNRVVLPQNDIEGLRDELLLKAATSMSSIDQGCKYHAVEKIFDLGKSFDDNAVTKACFEFCTDVYGNSKQREVLKTLDDIEQLSAPMVKNGERAEHGNIFAEAAKRYTMTHEKSSQSLDSILLEMKGIKPRQNYASKIVELCTAFTSDTPSRSDIYAFKKNFSAIPGFYDTVMRTKFPDDEKFVRAEYNLKLAVIDLNVMCMKYGQEKMFDDNNMDRLPEVCFDICRDFYMNDKQKEVFRTYDDMCKVSARAERKGLDELFADDRKKERLIEHTLDDILNGLKEESGTGRDTNDMKDQRQPVGDAR